MSWQKAEQKDLLALIQFLRDENEQNHLHFSSQVFNWGKPKIPESKAATIYILKDELNTIKAAIMKTCWGAIFPIMEPPSLQKKEIDWLIEYLNEIQLTIHAIIGSAKRVRFIIDLINKKYSEIISFKLLTLSKLPAPKQMPGTIKRVKARIWDTTQLYPLEEAYQIEEVIRKKSNLDSSLLLKKFSSQIRKERIFYLKENGKPISKAGTNATGFDWVQIGGVYTLPERRGEGLAEITLWGLFKEILSRQKRLALFVKKENASALNLYNRMGFKEEGNFIICYY